MIRCITNLEKHQSVPQSLSLLYRIIGNFNIYCYYFLNNLGTYPDKKNKKMDNISSVIEWLETNYKLLDLFFEELVHYKSLAKNALSNIKSIETINLDNQNLVGKLSHLQQIKERLDFLEFILKNSNLLLSIKQIDIFWSCIILNPLTYQERELGFSWLENIRGNNQVKLFYFLLIKHIL